MTDAVVVVFVTAPNAAVAESLGRTLVEERLAACANVVPGLVSLYRWQGTIQRDDEVLVILKTRADSFAALERRVAELHPYDLPEIIALPVVDGHVPYLSWVRERVGA